MNENKEFQINLIGETIMRNSEGIYASKSPEIDVEIVVDKDYVIDALVRNCQDQEQILQDDLTALKQKLENEIQVLNKRIKYREGPCFHDEEKAIERFHSEAFAYERVIKMMDVLKGE
ncbi:hypothetical protein [Bacillus altitudinis]|uniref:hypothetical protein n=1 Tax=Bacillus altitudinis TaxID=293387 RepID=UPI003315C907